MTEEEKFEKLTSKRIGFMDITDTMVCTLYSSSQGYTRRERSLSVYQRF
jgi:hypothetical protein